ncbi:unnamed protein product [Anisakis simplex]|uniref:Calcineurin-like phosphoesterase domain-containing protein n=1 Tax=Anisakis simplex TaxID=6269 RepID=A0A3P6N399_ANISI|nr:unnamed protein product [Anisakis simplex]
MQLRSFRLKFQNEGKVGDQFGRQIESVAAYVPYMTVVGNHEQAYNFSHFINRYTMPNSDHNLFYSFDLGVAHFIAFSTEFYYYLKYGSHQIARQWEWLNNDLKVADQDREKRPWIITLGHRPMYCSNFQGDCARYESRVGEVYNGTRSPYVDPPAPVHVVTGSAVRIQLIPPLGNRIRES